MKFQQTSHGWTEYVMSNLGKMVLLVLAAVLPVALAGGCTSDQMPQLVKVLGEPYLLRTIFQQTNEPPEQIYYDMGDIFFHHNNKSFVLKKDSAKIDELRYRVLLKSKKVYIDPEGRAVTNHMGRVSVTQGKKIVKLSMKDHEATQMAVDFDRSRVFLLGCPYGNDSEATGRVFVVDTGSLDVAGGVAELARVEDLGARVVAISADKTTGNVALCVAAGGAWWLKILEKIESSAHRYPSITDVNRRALESAVLFGGREIIRLYEEAVRGNFREAFEEYNVILTLPSISPRTSSEPPAQDEPTRAVPGQATALKTLKKHVKKLSENILSASVASGNLKEYSRHVKVVTPSEASKEITEFVCASKLELDGQTAALREAELHARKLSEFFHSLKDSLDELLEISDNIDDYV